MSSLCGTKITREVMGPNEDSVHTKTRIKHGLKVVDRRLVVFHDIITAASRTFSLLIGCNGWLGIKLQLN